MQRTKMTKEEMERVSVPIPKGIIIAEERRCKLYRMMYEYSDLKNLNERLLSAAYRFTDKEFRIWFIWNIIGLLL
jgi:hypothetical protein